MNFEFATATRILFGAGKLGQIGPLASEMGWRALVVIGMDLGKAQPLLAALAASEVVPTVFMVAGEPTVDLVAHGVEMARRENCDLVVGFGGGSALDAAKAIAALLTNPGEINDYLEVIGRGQPLLNSPLPYIAIPTTAGTGAEVTRNAVLKSPQRRVKVSLRSPTMLPRLALVDPQLTYSMPPEVTASTGLDALTQLIEPYVSNSANPLTDALCREGMSRAARSLRRAYQQGDDPAARQDMSLASLFGGLALANAKLGAVHGFAGPLGGMFPAPHGVVCARLLPYVMEANLDALRQRDALNPALERYGEIARILTGDTQSAAEDGLAWVQDLCQALNVPPLSTYGLGRADFPAVIENSARASSMKGNPIELSAQEMQAILERAL
ncbi:MAG: iron-containing alcohol dehydrogenase [Anaerolineales bacterium]|nr:iron-containing alcohol dehydrogenase [Anaerolineales bacterium]